MKVINKIKPHPLNHTYLNGILGQLDDDSTKKIITCLKINNLKFKLGMRRVNTDQSISIKNFKKDNIMF